MKVMKTFQNGNYLQECYYNMRETNLRTWIKKFNNDDYTSADRKTQIEAGWYDWFCRDSSLRSKTYKLGKIINRIRDGGKVNLDTTYVFFKNNCPMVGPLYDDFRLCSLENGNVLFTITIDSPHDPDFKYTVFGHDKNGVGHWGTTKTDNLFQCNNVRELLHWLNPKW